ncbi:MAG: TlpA family protein disulfide reductase [Clostridiales bacterium]|nr:TlpA family protein disulfide reductase [Clostridiales bacterium]
MKKKLIVAVAVAMAVSLFACTACKKKKHEKSNPNVSVGVDYFPEINFTIRDIDGNYIDETVFSNHTLTMINFWEPWCGPCVSEMPELEKLYENYKDKGFYIIGVFSSTDMMSEVKKVMSNAGTTYPLAAYDSAFDRFQTGSVPTTIFVDQNGWVLPLGAAESEKLYIGARAYEDWAALVDTYYK